MPNNKAAATALNDAIAITRTLAGAHTGYTLGLKINTIADVLDDVHATADRTAEGRAIRARATKLEDELARALA